MFLHDAPLYQQIFLCLSLSVLSAATLRPTYFGNLQATYNAADVPLSLGCTSHLRNLSWLPNPAASYPRTPLEICIDAHPRRAILGAGQLIASNNGVDLSHKYPVIARERFTIGNTEQYFLNGDLAFASLMLVLYFN